MSLTRRSLLGVAAGLTVASCRPNRRHPDAAGADRAALTAAAEAEQALLESYDRAVAGRDAVTASRLTAARRRHTEHLRALRAAVGGSSPAAAPPPPSTSLRATLRASAARLHAAAVGAHDGKAAALLASIAAEHHADAAPAATT